MPPTIIDHRPPHRADDHNRVYLYIAYACFAGGFVSGFTPVIGVIMAYVRRNEVRGTPYFDHCHFLIRTFWISLLGLLAAAVLTPILIGIPLLAAVCIWFLFRLIAGVMKLVDNKPLNPYGWTV